MSGGSWITFGITIGLIVLFSSGLLLAFGRTSLFVARRYLFSKKKQNVINLITLISMIGVMVVTAALIIVLSIFNGFHGLIQELFSSFDPDIKIVAAQGRTLPYSDSLMVKLTELEEVKFISPVVENKAMIKYYDKQHIVQVKGIRKAQLDVCPIGELVYKGKMKFLNEPGGKYCVLGSGVADIINANLKDDIHPLEILAAREAGDMIINPENAFKSAYVFASGYFSVQIEYDNKFVLVDFDMAQKLFGFDDQVTSYELKLGSFEQAEAVKEKIAEMVGSDYKVLTWYEQHQTLYDVMKNEKLIAYLVLTLILLLAGVNIVGSLSMIVLEKNKDIAILKSIGANKAFIRRIFLAEGFLIGGIGGMAGIVLGFVVGFAQTEFGLVKLSGGDSFLIDAYPIIMHPWDFVFTFLTVFGLSLLASIFPSNKAANKEIVKALRE